MNKEIRKKAEASLQKDGTGGSCAFNLTLINDMDPDRPSAGLREEPNYDMGLVSVSWHADSSLQQNSTISVYQVRTVNQVFVNIPFSAYPWRNVTPISFSSGDYVRRL